MTDSIQTLASASKRPELPLAQLQQTIGMILNICRRHVEFPLKFKGSHIRFHDPTNIVLNVS